MNRYAKRKELTRHIPNDQAHLTGAAGETMNREKP
jgi:hypothetical protein